MDDLWTQSMFALALFAVAPIVLASVVGLLVATLQAATQIQEPTLLFGLKLFVVAGSLWILVSLKGEVLSDLMRSAFLLTRL